MSKKWYIALILSLAIIPGTLISACQSKTTVTHSTMQMSRASDAFDQTSGPDAFDCVPGSITASGSTALQPYVEAVAGSYTAQCPSASITVQPNDSLTGLNDVHFSVSQIGSSDVPALANQADLVDHQVAIAIFTLIVNPDVKVSTIKTSDLSGIYTGKINNWHQLGGINMPITIISRPDTSGTRATFNRFVLEGLGEHPGHTRNITVASTGLLVQTVAQTRGAIGYASLDGALSTDSRVSIVKIDGKVPSRGNVQTNNYKFWAIEHMYTKGQATGLTQAFLNYMFSKEASTIAKQLKFVNIKDIPPNVINTHKKV